MVRKARPQASILRRNSTENNEPLENLSCMHLLQNGTKGWFTFSKIPTNILQMLHESYQHLREVYLRFDNTGCFHCTPLLARIFLTIRQYTFSKA